MIKKAIAFIEKFVNDVMEERIDDDYHRGARDVAENVINGLEGIDELYSIYELNPYAKPGADRWEEIAVTRDPETCKELAEALFRYHHGQIDLRYEYKEHTVFEIRLVGSEYRSFHVGRVNE
jgi:hypothetical protein